MCLRGNRLSTYVLQKAYMAPCLLRCSLRAPSVVSDNDRYIDLRSSALLSQSGIADILHSHMIREHVRIDGPMTPLTAQPSRMQHPSSTAEMSQSPTASTAFALAYNQSLLLPACEADDRSRGVCKRIGTCMGGKSRWQQASRPVRGALFFRVLFVLACYLSR
jgi:hypothetical protein